MDELGIMDPITVGGSGAPVTFATTRFGEVTVAESRVLAFPRGLVGLPNARRFTFLHDEESPGLFYWMQSLDEPNLAFVVCDPRPFFPEYTVPLTLHEQAELGLDGDADGLICVILVVPEDPHQITANLRGPIVLNPRSRVGTQVVLAGDEYPVAARIFSPEEKEDGCSF